MLDRKLYACNTPYSDSYLKRASPQTFKLIRLTEYIPSGKSDVQTGKAVQMPAVVDIPAYAVRVVDGMIQVGLPKE